MSKFLGARRCPVCNGLMMFENDTLDNYIVLYECYTCYACGYQVGTELGIAFEYLNNPLVLSDADSD